MKSIRRSILPATVAYMMLTACGSNNSSKRDDSQLSGSDSQQTANFSESSSAFPKQNVTDPSATTNAAGSSQDTSFVAKAVDGNKAEIKFCELALAKSSDNNIRNIANHLKTDHTNLLDQLEKMGKRSSETKASSQSGNDTGIAYLPTDVQAKIRDLAALPASAFDKKWVEALIAKHAKTINDYQAALADNSNVDVKKFITNALPKIKMHKSELDKWQKIHG